MNLQKTLVATFLFITAQNLFAHHGGTTGTGFSDGFLHPFTGLDHMLAMLAVGLWAAHRSKQVWMLPAGFLIFMFIGGMLGFAGLALPFVETGIAVSIFIIGILIALSTQLSTSVSLAMVALFALLHGHAHGAELSLTASAMSASLGFMSASSVILLTGIGLHRALLQMRFESAYRLAGGFITMAGMLVLFGVL